MFVAAMNPCPCGNYPDYRRCSCTEQQIRRYQSKVSGPLLDRIDIRMEVKGVKQEVLFSKQKTESSKTIRARVEQARQMQKERFAGTGLLLVKEVFESFSLSPFSPLPPVSAPPRYLKDVEKVGRGRDLQMMFTYHVKDVSEEEIFLSPYLKNAVFYGMDAVFNEFMTAEGFPFYSVDADYAVLGGELIFYWLVHVKKRDVNAFKEVAQVFERSVLKAPLMSVVRPFLGDNLVFLYDNPERLVNRYTDLFEDSFRAVTLEESRRLAMELSDNRLYDVWKTFLLGEKKIFLIGKQ